MHKKPHISDILPIYTIISRADIVNKPIDSRRRAIDSIVSLLALSEVSLNI